jgi:Uncharacterized protein conserved in bacteria
MLKLENHLGVVDISRSFIKKTAGTAALSVFGVAGICTSIKDFILGNSFGDHGIKLIGTSNDYAIKLRLNLAYGVNIAETARAVAEKVRYAVYSSTGVRVSRITICIDKVLI